jgi:hypothetical protein
MTLGGTVLSGIKSLGEMAYSVAKARITDHGCLGRRVRAAILEYTTGITPLTQGTGSSPPVAGNAQSPSEPALTLAPDNTSPFSKTTAGSHIKIPHPAPLLTSPTLPPTVISEFTASRRQPILDITFASHFENRLRIAENMLATGNQVRRTGSANLFREPPPLWPKESQRPMPPSDTSPECVPSLRCLTYRSRK